ncbi:MAG: hypothetical protein PHZ09_04935 [Eubacteriales bacterium]|jgi:hypothetical protein|nr:hypothetical protein [Eubacteriales bacterium]
MEPMTWIVQTGLQGAKTAIISEYVLNDLGVFVKRERRVSKKSLLNAVTGFRVGYAPVPGAAYRSAPLDRDAILWRKVTGIKESDDRVIVRGNRNSEIVVCFLDENRESGLRYIAQQRQRNPVVAAADYDAASWLCWREDDDWGDPMAPLAIMIENEKDTERFIEGDVLAETELDIEESEGMICARCGKALCSDSVFCEGCGSRVL